MIFSSLKMASTVVWSDNDDDEGVIDYYISSSSSSDESNCPDNSDNDTGQETLDHATTELSAVSYISVSF